MSSLTLETESKSETEKDEGQGCSSRGRVWKHSAACSKSPVAVTTWGGKEGEKRRAGERKWYRDV